MGKDAKKKQGAGGPKKNEAQKQLGAHENALQCFLLLFPQYSPWALSLMVWHMNCIKLLLISCRVAERWITVRGLSYICHWPLSTSVVLSTLGWLIIPLLIQRQLVMPHTTAIGQQHQNKILAVWWQKCPENSGDLISRKYSDCKQRLLLIGVNDRIL